MSGRAMIYVMFFAGMATICGVTGWKAYDLGQHTERAEWLARENSDLRETRKETQRLVAEVKEQQNEYNKAIELIRRFERRPTADRLRQQELAASIARADADRLRDHATQAERDLEWTEAERSRFGVEAAEASAAAHALNRNTITQYRKTLR